MSNFTRSEDVKTAASLVLPAVQPAYLRQKDPARYLGITKPFLIQLERKGVGPRKIKLGRAAIYRIADLDFWMTQSEVRHA